MLVKQIQSLNRDVFLARASGIPDKPSNRIAEPLKSLVYNSSDLLNKGKAYFDVHAHSFTIDHVPKDFIKILNWVSNKDKAKLLQWVDKKFGVLMGLDNPKKVLDNLINVYDKYFFKKNITPHLFIVNLAMDMERGISGAPTFNYQMQLQQLLSFLDQSSPIMNTGKSYDYQTTILPFLAIDPNNKEAFEYFLSAFLANYNTTGIPELNNVAPFFGLKLYPSLGYSPSDPILLDLYEICEQKSIPITTHCGGIRTRTNKREIEIGYRKIENGQIKDSKKTVKVYSKQNFKNIFLDPLHWEKVLKMFPKLKLNLAHFGDNIEWKNYHANNHDPKTYIFKTLKMIKDFENVYADISYSYSNEENINAIQIMMQNSDYKHRILNGSDFFLTEIEKFTTKEFLEKLEAKFINNQEGLHLLTSTNPYNFLFKEA